MPIPTGGARNLAVSKKPRDALFLRRSVFRAAAASRQPERIPPPQKQQEEPTPLEEMDRCPKLPSQLPAILNDYAPEQEVGLR